MDKLGLVYFQIHEKLKSKALPDGSITKKKIYNCFGKNYHIKKDVKEGIFMEMEMAGLITSMPRGIVIINENEKSIKKIVRKKIMELKKNSY